MHTHIVQNVCNFKKSLNKNKNDTAYYLQAVSPNLYNITFLQDFEPPSSVN